MKTIIKVATVFFFLLSFMACKESKDNLTKDYALKQIQLCENQRPIQVEKGIFIGKMSYNNGTSGTSEVNYLKRLKNNGVITLDFISSKNQQLSNRTQVLSLYEIQINDAYKKYITKQKGNIAYVKVLYREVQEVTNVELLNEVKAKVTAKFKKVKTPFYDVSLEKFPLKERPDEYTDVVKFFKSKKEGWRSCLLRKTKSN